ncbi:hypothetical protein BCV71DRAFT_236455 [Rhizopus microsporus]|uniref:Uncharacterized protein n=1 Tax=Rhizopus microsporus TaxID=58291 RepID=A0A1X0RX68_RHIZD|nr:hypothetical protein BCV71DRAFT_236455 [Rhizopus microsporus]
MTEPSGCATTIEMHHISVSLKGLPDLTIYVDVSDFRLENRRNIIRDPSRTGDTNSNSMQQKQNRSRIQWQIVSAERRCLCTNWALPMKWFNSSKEAMRPTATHSVMQDLISGIVLCSDFRLVATRYCGDGTIEQGECDNWNQLGESWRTNSTTLK